VEFLDHSGISQWNISLSSSDSGVLERLRRGYTVEDFDRVITRLIETGKPVICYFISGLPGDSEDNILNTIFYLAGIRVTLGLSNFYPVPGTSITDEIFKDNRCNINPNRAGGSSFYSYGRLSTDKLVTLFMVSRFINGIKQITDEMITNFLNSDLEMTYNDGLLSISDKSLLSLTGILISCRYRRIVGLTKVRDGQYRIFYYPIDNSITNRLFDFLESSFVVTASNLLISMKSLEVLWQKICQ